MAEPAETPKPRYSPHWNMRSKSAPDPNRIKLPPNEGRLTEPLSSQKWLARTLAGAGLQAGLMPADAVKRASECVEALRNEAIVRNLDSEGQKAAIELSIAYMRAPGITAGMTVAVRALECVRLLEEWRAKTRKAEIVKAKKREVV